MFAKIFGQIFDSSIAEDYNCRRMFMDMLVLADSDGVIDMTHEAISRRTNVPIDQVRTYIDQLQLPDPSSRSKVESGKRLVPIDEERGWGWKIVNYRHYRGIRDEEARRSYFREAKRVQRKREKKSNVKDSKVDTGGSCQIIPSTSSSLGEGVKGKGRNKCTQLEAEEFCQSIGLPKTDGEAMFHKWEGNGWSLGTGKVRDWKSVIRQWKASGFLPSQKNVRNGSTTPDKPVPYQPDADGYCYDSLGKKFKMV